MVVKCKIQSYINCRALVVLHDSADRLFIFLQQNSYEINSLRMKCNNIGKIQKYIGLSISVSPCKDNIGPSFPLE